MTYIRGEGNDLLYFSKEKKERGETSGTECV